MAVWEATRLLEVAPKVGGKFGLVTFEYKLEIGLARHIGARQDWTRGATGGCVVESLSAVRRLVGVTIADLESCEIVGECTGISFTIVGLDTATSQKLSRIVHCSCPPSACPGAGII